MIWYWRAGIKQVVKVNAKHVKGHIFLVDVDCRSDNVEDVTVVSTIIGEMA